MELKKKKKAHDNLLSSLFYFCWSLSIINLVRFGTYIHECNVWDCWWDLKDPKTKQRQAVKEIKMCGRMNCLTISAAVCHHILFDAVFVDTTVLAHI